MKLTGPATYTLTAADDGNPATAIERYVARVSLPNTLIAGTYNVSVSRDGVSWIPLTGQTLSVLADPATSTGFSVSSYGCSPNDAVDDTSCVVSAISAAKANGGGVVSFGVGTWKLGNSSASGVTGDGILVPPGVSLSGAGAGQTIVERETTWNQDVPTFTLQGGNTVQGFTFRDANVYTNSSAPAGTYLRLGVHFWAAHWYNVNDPTVVSGVTITKNTFDKPFVAIGDGGMPIDHLYITYNEFGSFQTGFDIEGNSNNVSQKTHLDNSIIAFNTFKPGSFIVPNQGAIASGVPAGYHLDFSQNTADGTSTQYLYNPGTDAKGWRAAFFWTLRGNSEEVLIAQNTATCTGDKSGDGEAFGYDGNHNTFALPAAQAAQSATTNTVTVAGPLLASLNSNALPGNYFVEHWVSVADGPGRGQVRKIVSYPVDSSGNPVLPVTFTVTPAWDVVPQTTSRITVSKEFWQVYTVDNLIDERQPTCTKANIDKPMAGVITLYGQTADSAVEGNVQHDSSGIVLSNGYAVTDNALPSEPTTSFQSFVDVRANTIDHEYLWASDCSWSGIQGYYAAGNTAGSSPPTEGYGISFSHNVVTQADGLHGGGINFVPAWWEGPAGTNWAFIESPLIFSNSISNISGAPSGAAPPYAACNAGGSRVGINLADSHVFHAVLASNTCTNVSTPLVDNGTATQKLCTSVGNPCECPAGLVGDWQFDESSGTSTADASANGDNGTLVNGPVWTKGETGDALNFAATTSYVSVANTGALNNLYNTGQGMTVTAWINPAGTGGGGGGRIVDKDNNNGGWFLKINNTGTSVQFAADQFGSAAIRNSADGSIVLNKWQHIAVTWDGSTDAQNHIHIFINGVQSDAAFTNGTGVAQPDDSTPFTIGNRTLDKARNFNGSIDAVRVYNRQLSQAEIQSLVGGGS